MQTIKLCQPDCFRLCDQESSMERTPIALKCHQVTEKWASQTSRVATFAWYSFFASHACLPLIIGCHCQNTSVRSLYFAVQPNCAEPWTEVIFADDKEGKIQVECYPVRRQCLDLNSQHPSGMPTSCCSELWHGLSLYHKTAHLS